MRRAVPVVALLAVAAAQPRGGCDPGPQPGSDSPDPCAALACGAECTIEPACRSATPPCMAPSLLGRCDAGGVCVATTVTCGPSPCNGKKCGDACSRCGDVPCMSPVATACDPWGDCVPVTPWLCYDACAGKGCGAACSPCPPGEPDCAAVGCVTSCDGAGRCACTGAGAACP